MFRFCLLGCILLIPGVVTSDNYIPDCVMDLAFLIDYSLSPEADANGNKAPERWNLTLSFFQNLTRNLDVQPWATRLASFAYGEYDGKLNFDFDQGHRKARVLNDIGDIKRNREEDGIRNPGYGLHEARTQIFIPRKGDRSDIPNVIVLLVTGEVSDGDMEDVIEEANLLKDSGTSIICIGASNAINADAMEKVVTEPSSENYFSVSGLESLNTIVDDIVTATCRAARNRQNATNPDKTSVAPTSMPVSDCVLDLVFLVDSTLNIAKDASGNCSSEKWNLMLGFFQDLTRDLDVQWWATHVASFTYGSNKVNLKFDLDQGQRKARVVDNIGDIRHDGELGGRKPGIGLDLANRRAFNPKYGDRSEIPNVVVLITGEVADGDMDQVMVEANLLKDLGTSIICIGVSNAINDDAMEKVVTEPSSENYFSVPGLESLNTIVDDVATATCRHSEKSTK